MQRELQFRLEIQYIYQDLLSWTIANSSKEGDHDYLNICLKIYNLFTRTVEDKNRESLFKFLNEYFPSTSKIHLRDSVAIQLLFTKYEAPLLPNTNLACLFSPFKKNIYEINDIPPLPEYLEDKVIHCWLDAVTLARKNKEIVTTTCLSEVIYKHITSQCDYTRSDIEGCSFKGSPKSTSLYNNQEDSFPISYNFIPIPNL